MHVGVLSEPFKALPHHLTHRDVSFLGITAKGYQWGQYFFDNYYKDGTG